MNHQATLMVRFDRVGLHHWPSPPKHLAYLAHPHRHTFGFEVHMTVTQADGEVLGHDLRETAETLVAGMQGLDNDFGARSCQAIARELGAKLAKLFDRLVRVDVWEDREFGARVWSAPEAK